MDAASVRRAWLEKGSTWPATRWNTAWLDRQVEKNGLLKQCQELGVRLIAYSPLGMGILTGKYTVENPPQGSAGGNMITGVLEKAGPLMTLIKRIGRDHAGKTPAQVAI